LECLVFGKRAALSALSDGSAAHSIWLCGSLPEGEAAAVGERANPPSDDASLGERLERDLGVERDGERLAALVDDLALVGVNDAKAASSGYSLVAFLAARSALMRTESRGAHYRSDYPDTSESWRGRILWQRDRGACFEEIDS
jgi:L-aspartate oxidase